MADLKMEIHEIIEVFEESEGSNWAKVLMKVSWNDGPVGLEIRSLDLSTIESDKPRISKGIRLSDEALTTLLYKLIEMGLGKKKHIKQLLKDRDSSIFGEEDEIEEDDENYLSEDDIFGSEEKIRKVKIRRIKD